LPEALPPGKYRVETIPDGTDASRVALGWALGTYAFDLYREKKKPAKAYLVWPKNADRAFVERLDFLTSTGHGDGGDYRARLGMTAIGPAKVITDLCVMEPDAVTRELTVTSLHPGVTREQVIAATGWQIQFAAGIAETLAPTEEELAVLRQLRQETENAHKEKEHA